VAKVEDHEVQVEIADNVKIKVLRSTISEVRGKGEGAPAGKAKAASG
jgi:preprotein translocase subunit YajC